MSLGFESETLEYKKSTSEMKEAMDSICAILNKHGAGILYFGVRPDGVPIGQTISEKTLRDISTAIENHIEPAIFPHISMVMLDGRTCVEVKFSGTNPPYYSYGKAKIRVADRDLPLSPEQLEEFILRKNDSSVLWESKVSDYTLEDIEEDILKIYLRKAREIERIDFDYTNPASVLNKLSLTCGSYLLNAGKVLFCDSALVELQMAIFATEERLTFNDIQRHTGNIFELVEAAELYIKNNIRWKIEFEDSLQRREIPEIPISALREALINSFCHKDYSAQQSNEVAIFKDRIEIYNPGRFPAGHTPEDFIERDERPVRRNPLITRCLYYSKDVESFGTGLKRIKTACDQAKVRLDFKRLKSGFAVVFYRSGRGSDADIAQVPRKYRASAAQDVGSHFRILRCSQKQDRDTRLYRHKTSGIFPKECIGPFDKRRLYRTYDTGKTYQ